MLKKIAEYRGVIIFYLLLVLFLSAISYQNRLIDKQMENSHNQIMTSN